MGTAGGAIISAGAIISIAGNLKYCLTVRLACAFCNRRAEQLPSIFGAIHPRFFTPHIAILVTAGVMLVLTLRSSFVAALTISAIARLVTMR